MFSQRWQVLLGDQRLAADIRDEHDVRRGDAVRAPARGRLRQHAGGGLALVGPLAQGLPLARRQAKGIHETFQVCAFESSM